MTAILHLRQGGRDKGREGGKDRKGETLPAGSGGRPDLATSARSTTATEPTRGLASSSA